MKKLHERSRLSIFCIKSLDDNLKFRNKMLLYGSELLNMLTHFTVKASEVMRTGVIKKP